MPDIQDVKHLPDTLNCVSCKTPLQGEYCHHCGEKQVKDKDFTIGKLTEQMVDIFTHVDSRLFLSFKYLLIRPGFLTVEYIRGARKAYMKPFQLFLLCNILFFFFMGSSDILLIPSKWFISDQYGEPAAVRTAEELASKNGYTMATLEALYNNKVTANSKVFVVMLLPFIALGTFVFGFKQHRQFGKHLVFSVYLLSFFMVFTVLCYNIMNLVPFLLSLNFVKYFVIGVVLLYLFLALRKFLDQTLFVRILATLFIGVWFISIMLLYRYVISWLTLVSM